MDAASESGGKRGWFVYSSVASVGKPSLGGATCASSSESGENIKVGTENQQWKLTQKCIAYNPSMGKHLIYSNKYLYLCICIRI